MINFRAGLSALLLTTTLGQPVFAADFSDPTWPCIQRKVERLSIGLMWPHPVEEAKIEGPTGEAVRDLAGALTLRRVSLEEAEARIAKFVGEHGADEPLISQVFVRVFDQVARRRSTIMEGIADFSLGQIALSERIEEARVEFDSLLNVENPDYDKLDSLEEQIDWDERIYIDRQKNLTYVCETPVLLEKRLFAIAQMLMQVVED